MTNPLRRRQCAAMAIIASALCALPAQADEIVWDEEEPEQVYIAVLRDPGGLVIGFDVGIGVFDAVCTDCVAAGGLSLDAFAGTQLASRFAVLADVWGVLHLLPSDGDSSGLAAHALATASGRLWLIPRLWLQAGVGLGALAVGGRGPESLELGPGFSAALGGELGHKPFSGVDLTVRFGGSSLDNELGERAFHYSIAATVGWHWN